ncbi:polyprenyl synthetase family protein [Candidatus Pacearchaeota archaeon]|nr:polyprenyl synthetase family protein [Candidatus Pacearchaeota archaeon]
MRNGPYSGIEVKVHEYMKKILKRVEISYEKEGIDTKNDPVLEIARYVINEMGPKGHFWRSKTLIATANAWKAPLRPSIACGALLDTLHLGSLVIDDFQDNSESRRGLPAVHILYGKEMAPLITFSLITWVDKEMLKRKRRSRKISNRSVRILDEIKDATDKAILGQGRDIGSRDSIKSIDDCINFYELKSGSLYSAAMAIGAILGGAQEKTVNRLRNCGYKFGAYVVQIKNDLCDVFADPEKLGKPAHEDIKRKNILSFINPKEAMDLSESSKKEVINELYEICGSRDIGDLTDLLGYIAQEQNALIKEGLEKYLAQKAENPKIEEEINQQPEKPQPFNTSLDSYINNSPDYVI